MPRKYSKSIPLRIQALLDDPVVRQINPWAFNTFLPSILSQYNRKGSLSGNQYNILENIESECTGVGREQALEKKRLADEKQAREDAEWKKEYEAKYTEDAKILVEYYTNGPRPEVGKRYYENTLKVIEEGRVPFRGSFMKLYNNSFAQRALEEWKKEPEYPARSTVMARKKFSEDRRHPLFGVQLAFVLKTNVEAPTAAKGGKKYLVLPKGNVETGVLPIVCEERHLKRYRKNK